MTAPKRKRETAKERDERIVAEASSYAAVKHPYANGVWLVIPQRYDANPTRSDSMAKALARIGNRFARSRRGKGGGE